VRLKIVINRNQSQPWWAQSWWGRLDPTWSWLGQFGAHAWDIIARAVRLSVRALRQTVCGLTGHEDVLHLRRQRLALACTRCGRVTPGWDLSDPTPGVRRAERARYLELVRRRS
jgi:hypothetical protein